LVNEDIKIGERILKLLDANNIDVSSAFWFLFSDIQEWRFVLAISDFDKIGSQKTYLKILKILNKEQIEEQDFPFEMLYPLFQKDNKINNLKLNTLGGTLINYPNSYTLISQKEGRGVLNLFNTEKGVTIFANPARFELLKKYCTERFGIYRDSLVKVVDKCDIRVCSCIK
jgi:hypothetical protein